jgi:hypothetical protein
LIQVAVHVEMEYYSVMYLDHISAFETQYLRIFVIRVELQAITTDAFIQYTVHLEMSTQNLD